LISKEYNLSSLSTPHTNCHCASPTTAALSTATPAAAMCDLPPAPASLDVLMGGRSQMERRESIYEDDEAFNASLDALLNGAYVGDSQHSYSALMGPSPTPLAGATAIMAECTEFTAPPPLTVLTAGRKRKLSMALAAGGGAPGRAAGATASLEHPVTTLTTSTPSINIRTRAIPIRIKHKP
jgi:hypothetical protein